MLDNLAHVPSDIEAHHFQCTFHEMAIALEYDVHVALGGPKADLNTKAALLQKIMRALTLQCGLRFTDDVGAKSFKQLFQYKKYQCTNSITGLGLNGIGRRPAWLHGSDTEKCIVLNLHHARTLYEQSKPKDPARFGAEFRIIRHGRRINPVWKPPVMTQVYAQLAANKKRVSTAISLCHSACHFGHTLAKKTYCQDLVPVWRGAKLDAPLCQACHRTMTYEMNTQGVPFVTHPSIPPIYSDITAPTGPCYFGHTTSSAVHCQASGAKSGQPRWFRIPVDMEWGKVTSEDTLCQGCYHKYRKAASLQTSVAKPAPQNKRLRIGVMLPAPPLALGGPRCEASTPLYVHHSQSSPAGAVSLPLALEVQSGLASASGSNFFPSQADAESMAKLTDASDNDSVPKGRTKKRCTNASQTSCPATKQHRVASLPSTLTQAGAEQRSCVGKQAAGLGEGNLFSCLSPTVSDVAEVADRNGSNSACVVYASNKKRRTNVVESQHTHSTTTIGKCGGEPDPLDDKLPEAEASQQTPKFTIHIDICPADDVPSDAEELNAYEWAKAASIADAATRASHMLAQPGGGGSTTATTVPSGTATTFADRYGQIQCQP